MWIFCHSLRVAAIASVVDRAGRQPVASLKPVLSTHREVSSLSNSARRPARILSVRNSVSGISTTRQGSLPKISAAIWTISETEV